VAIGEAHERDINSTDIAPGSDRRLRVDCPDRLPALQAATLFVQWIDPPNSEEGEIRIATTDWLEFSEMQEEKGIKGRFEEFLKGGEVAERVADAKKRLVKVLLKKDWLIRTI
jgi:hypothetical protein